MAEKALISRIRRRAGKVSAAVPVGIGDDCAVLRIPPGHEALVTTDLTLEGVHFRREWHPPESVGHRCLARGLSDIAAMGGKPLAVFLSLAVPRILPQGWLDRFFVGLTALGDRYGVTLAGGDTAESPDGILADIVVLGSVPRGEAVLRSGARAGDGIFVSGELGGSAAVLQQMMGGAARKLGSKMSPRKLPQHFFPEPRLKIGQMLREKASAMIDLSDGLSTDLARICEEGGRGAEVWKEKIPVARFGNRRVDLRLALHGGEDYELLFTAAPGAKIPAKAAGIPITQIGRVTRNKGTVLVDGYGRRSKLRPQGWEHFKSGR